MKLRILDHAADVGRAATATCAHRIREALTEKGRASILIAAGPAQAGLFDELVEAPEIRWDKVTCFHVGEYVDLPIVHPASHRRRLWEQFVRRLPIPVAAFHYVNGEAGDPQVESRRVGSILHYHVIDAALIGFGENAQLAFHNSLAHLDCEDPYLVVQLDEVARRQQVRESWFEEPNDVPDRCITVSIRQILKSRSIICCAVEDRQAMAVRQVVEGPMTSRAPAVILQEHEDCTLFLDRSSASGLSTSLLERR